MPRTPQRLFFSPRPTRSARAFAARGMRLGTGRTPMLLRSGRLIGATAAMNPYVRGGLITAAALEAGRLALRKRTPAPIKRAFRQYAQPLRSRLPPKQTVEILNETGKDTSTLYHESLTLPNEGTLPNQREGNVINLSGIKFCLEMENIFANGRLYYNIALVQEISDPSNKNPTFGTRFFRNANGIDRGANFPLQFAITNHCTPINTDKFRVFWHHRGTLGAFPGGVGIPAQSTVSNVHKIMKWVRFKKQLRFDSSNFSNGQLHLVYWADRQGDTTAVPITAAFDLRGEAIMYFREPN